MTRHMTALAVALLAATSPPAALSASSATTTVTITTKVNAMDWTGAWSRMEIVDAQGKLKPAPDPTRVKFEVDPQLFVSMSVGCNQIGSQLQPGEGGAITFAPGMATRMGCEGAIGEAEDRLTAALPAIARYEVRGDDVAFMDAGGRVLLVVGR